MLLYDSAVQLSYSSLKGGVKGQEEVMPSRLTVLSFISKSLFSRDSWDDKMCQRLNPLGSCVHGT